MNATATPTQQIVRTVVNAMVPEIVEEFEGKLWAKFRYHQGDKPWKTFPKVIELGGTFLVWSCYNSDTMLVYYREVDIKSLAFPSKAKPRN